MPPTAPSELLRAKLKLRQLEAQKLLSSRPDVAGLLSEAKFGLQQLPEHPAKLLAGAAIAGTMLLTPPAAEKALPTKSIEEKVQSGLATNSNTSQWLASKLEFLANRQPGHLNQNEEKNISILLRSAFGINAVPELEGQRLNHTLGYTGYEQHLKRYPGDTLTNHDEEKEAGIAPGLSGWGYFAKSKAEFTEQDMMREKYYFAVQTLYLENWHKDWVSLSKWYKHRKMIMVNVANGKAVVGVVGDAGPAKFTGKHFGGSPEAMKALDLHLGSRKGKVILYFIDDPENKVPLGPLDYNLNQGPPLYI